VPPAAAHAGSWHFSPSSYKGPILAPTSDTRNGLLSISCGSWLTVYVGLCPHLSIALASYSSSLSKLPRSAKARLTFPVGYTVDSGCRLDDTFSFEILHTLQSVHYTNTPFLLEFLLSLLFVLSRYLVKHEHLATWKKHLSKSTRPMWPNLMHPQNHPTRRMSQRRIIRARRRTRPLSLTIW